MKATSIPMLATVQVELTDESRTFLHQSLDRAMDEGTPITIRLAPRGRVYRDFNRD